MIFLTLFGGLFMIVGGTMAIMGWRSLGTLNRKIWLNREYHIEFDRTETTQAKVVTVEFDFWELDCAGRICKVERPQIVKLDPSTYPPRKRRVGGGPDLEVGEYVSARVWRDRQMWVAFLEALPPMNERQLRHGRQFTWVGFTVCTFVALFGIFFFLIGLGSF